MVVGVAKIFMVVGIIIFLAYPALLMFFMTRDNVIDACQPDQAPTPV
jgi:hypothetical protein